MLSAIWRNVIPDMIRNPLINKRMLNQVQHDAVYVKLNTTLVEKYKDLPIEYEPEDEEKSMVLERLVVFL